MHAEGLLDRPSRGLYVLAASEPSEHRTIAEASKRVPQGIVCLLSALRLHDLTTQAPFEVWLAIDEKARTPQVEYPRETVVAEKFQAMVTLGIANSRMKDFFDVWTLARHVVAAGGADRNSDAAGGMLWLLDRRDGANREVAKLPTAATFDGLAVAHDSVFVSTRDGRLSCFGP